MKQFVVIIVVAFIAGCFINDDFITGTDNQFSCDDDDDCLSSFECKAGVCTKVEPGNTDCPDADGDGYGVGQERSFCDLCRTQDLCDEDFDDEDDSLFPGAPDICDGKDNDNDMEIDNFDIECSSVTDCGSITLPAGARLACETVCVVKMINTVCGPNVDPCPCTSDPLPCNNGSYPEVPEECQ